MVDAAGAEVRRVLIVSTVELEPDVVAELVGPDAETVVVVPAVELSRLQWLTNDEDAARVDATSTAGEIAEAAPGRTVATRAGDPDPLLAVEDALAEFDATEVVVVTRTGEDASWLERRVGPTPTLLGDRPLTHLRRG